MIQLQWHFVRCGGILFENFVRILAKAIFAEAILTAVPFRILCALLFAAFVQLVWTVCDGGFDNHFESAPVANFAFCSGGFVGGIRCISFRF